MKWNLKILFVLLAVASAVILYMVLKQPPNVASDASALLH